MKNRSSNSNLIDSKVYWSMAVFAAIFFVVLSFRFKNFEPCTEVEISVKSGPIYVGELIQFKALSKKEEANIQWDFGGQSKRGKTVSYIFDAPGRYEVYLQTSKKCMGYKTVYVTEAPKVKDIHLKPTFTGPLTVEVGIPATFEDNTPNATQWEWRFGETNKIDASKQKVTYTFQTPGTKRVILIVNGNLQDELMVLVTPKPINNPNANKPSVPKKPEPQRKEPEGSTNKNNQDSKTITIDDIKVNATLPDISTEELEAIVEGIIEKKIAITELTAYACVSEHMQVSYNGNMISAKQLQEELWGIRKKSKIKSLEIIVKKDPHNCIYDMTINLKKKWL